MLNGKVILVTGGTGSFGKKFVKKVFEKYEPAKVVIYSRDELKQFEMQNSNEYQRYYNENRLRYFIGDVRDYYRLKMAMEDVDVVVHAAALKHVPACEYNPFEAVKTNIIGGQNVIDASIECGVNRVVALSTDKACAPINLYGATKLTSDKLFIAANNYKGKHDIRFSVVRYGNVMGSRGSVIPFFMEKRKTGVLPITDERMTRFNITLSEGVELVFFALTHMFGGELFVPKIPSYRILDLAKAIGPDCEIETVGLRPGEKIHEEMITRTDSINTIEFKKYFIVMPSLQNINTEKITRGVIGDVGTVKEYGFSYNSFENNWYLTVPELVNLIEHKMNS